MNTLPSLSIFFPFWNEEKNIQRVVEDAIQVAGQVAKKWEIIMINDGSADKTEEIAKRLCKKHPNLSLITHHPNRGYGAALAEGFLNAKYDYIVFTDGDGQFDFSQVTRFIENIDDADMVIGFRLKRRDTKIIKRLMLMKLLKIWDFIFFGFLFRDIDCGFKMFRKSAVERIMPLRSEGAMVTTEILAKAKYAKLRIKEVGVDHFPRKYGEQTGANLPVVARAVLETFVLWLDIHNGRI